MSQANVERARPCYAIGGIGLEDRRGAGALAGLAGDD